MAACPNCGAELPLNARFCPNCAAPAPREPGAIEAEDPRRRWAERVAFGVLVALTAVLLALAVLVFVFGVFVET